MKFAVARAFFPPYHGAIRRQEGLTGFGLTLGDFGEGSKKWKSVSSEWGAVRETIWYLGMFKAFNQEAEGKGKGLNCHWRKSSGHSRQPG